MRRARQLIHSSLALLVSTAPAGCGGTGSGSSPSEGEAAPTAEPADFEHEHSEENLRALFELLNAPNPHSAEQQAKMARITRRLFPDAALLERHFRAEVPKRMLRHLRTYDDPSLKDDVRAAGVFRPADETHTEIHIYRATTDELSEYAPGAEADTHFDDRLDRFPYVAVQNHLRPGVTLYLIELTRPGESKGVPFPVFVWDEGRWRTLGPFWSSMRTRALVGLDAF